MCFGFQKKRQVYDITVKQVSTWWGGTKTVPTTGSEQRKLRAEILRKDPRARIIDSSVKRAQEIDRFADTEDELEEDGW